MKNPSGPIWLLMRPPPFLRGLILAHIVPPPLASADPRQISTPSGQAATPSTTQPVVFYAMMSPSAPPNNNENLVPFPTQQNIIT